MRNNGWALPEHVLTLVRIGSYDVDLTEIPDGLPQDQALWPKSTRRDVPLVLPFPACGSLLFECQGAGRSVAVEGIRSMDHAATVDLVPARKTAVHGRRSGRAGEEFSAFMNLADYDEQLIAERIWTERSQIEDKLSELSEAMEKYPPSRGTSATSSSRSRSTTSRPAKSPSRIGSWSSRTFRRTSRDDGGTAARQHRDQRGAVRRLHVGQCRHPTAAPARLRPGRPRSLWADVRLERGRFVSSDPDLGLSRAIETPPRAADFAEIVRLVGIPVERRRPRRGRLRPNRPARRQPVDPRQPPRHRRPLGRAGATKPKTSRSDAALRSTSSSRAKPAPASRRCCTRSSPTWPALQPG